MSGAHEPTDVTVGSQPQRLNATTRGRSRARTSECWRNRARYATSVARFNFTGPLSTPCAQPHPNGDDESSQDTEMVLDDIANDSRIDRGVAVNDDIPEPDRRPHRALWRR